MRFSKRYQRAGSVNSGFYSTPCVLSNRGKIWVSALVCLFVSLFTTVVYAQEQWEKEGEGEIKDVEIEIVKDRRITLPRATRNFEKISPRPYEPIKPVITYEVKNLQFATADYKPIIRPLKLKQEELSKTYGNYLSGGLGNYSSLFLEGSATTKRDKNKFLGAHLYTRSFGSGPVADKNSASAATQLEVFGKSMGETITLSGEARYENRGAYFYGYNPATEIDRDKIRQSYDRYGASVGIENTKANDFNFTLKGGFSYLQDYYKETEGETSLTFSSDYKLNEKRKFILNADYFLISRKDAFLTTDPRHLFRIKPAYQFSPAENLLLTTGLNVAFQNDQYSGSKDLHVYPHVMAQYDLSPSFEVYGVVTGDMDKVNLHSLSAENIWLNSGVPIYHTNRALEFKAGVNGKIGRKVAVGAGVAATSLKNLYFYQNVRNDLNLVGTPVGVAFDKFDLVYDGNTKRINPFAEISFAHTETFKLTVRGDYFNYDTEVIAGAWHRPTYRVNIVSRYNLYEKISLEAGLMAQGGMEAVWNAVGAE